VTPIPFGLQRKLSPLPRQTPLRWEKIVCVFEKLGYKVAGQKGSHIKLEKPGVARPPTGQFAVAALSGAPTGGLQDAHVPADSALRERRYSKLTRYLPKTGLDNRSRSW
jgi:hypothetical protein